MKKVALAVMACLLGSVAWAQTVDVPVVDAPAITAAAPTAFADVPNLTESESIAGLNTWVSQGTNMMFMQDPESGTLIAGFPFDAEGKSLHPALADQEGADFEDMVRELFGPVVKIPDEYAPTVEERMSALTEEERRHALADLVERLSGVEGEEAFNTAVEGWLETLEPADDGAAEGVEAPDAPANVANDTEETAAAGADAAEATIGDADGPSLLEAVRRSTTMQVGELDAPLIYVITDPSCVPCRVTNDLLRDKVEAGELQMRVVMVDVVDEDSLGTIAGIVTAEDPAQTFLDMTAEEGVEMPFARTAGIPDDIMKGLEANYAMAEAYKIPQLPFIAFETEDGPAYISSVPAPEQVAAALPPSEADQVAAEVPAADTEAADVSEADTDEVDATAPVADEASPAAAE